MKKKTSFDVNSKEEEEYKLCTDKLIVTIQRSINDCNFWGFTLLNKNVTTQSQ